MKDILVQEYNNLVKVPKKPLSLKNNFIINFINGTRVEIKGKSKKK